MKTIIQVLYGTLIFTLLFSCQNSQTEQEETVNSEETVVPKMKMTTDIPEGISTPNTLNSNTLGELNFFDGVPLAETEAKVYDYVDLHNEKRNRTIWTGK
jgi:hypothetical protein